MSFFLISQFDFFENKKYLPRSDVGPNLFSEKLFSQLSGNQALITLDLGSF